MNRSSITKKLAAAVVSACLVVVSPGLAPYEAFAGDFGGKSGTSAPLPQLPATTVGGSSKISSQPGLSTGLSLPDVNVNVGLNLPAQSLPGVQTPAAVSGAPAAALPGAGAVSSTKLSASAPNGGGASDGSNGKLEPSKTDAPAAQPASATSEASQETALGGLRNAGAELADSKKERGAALSWLFDRFKRKAAPADAVVAGLESSAANGLVKAAPAKKAPFFKRMRERFDLSEFNASEKSYLAAESVFYLALTVYLASLPILVMGITGDAAATGIARGIHYWTMAGAALFAGEIVSRSPMKRVLRMSAMTRATIFGAIGVTALAGILGGAAGWPMFLALVGMNALVISMHSLVNLKGGGAARVFDSKKKVEKAGYLYSMIASSLMIVVPPLLGWPIDALSKAHGPLVGSGVGYLVVGALMGVVALLYSRVKPLPKKTAEGEKSAEPALKAFKTFFTGLWATRHGKYGLSAAFVGGLLLLASPLLGLLATIPALVLAAGGVMVAFNWEAMKAVWNNTTIRARSGMATFEAFIDDALFAVVMPSFAVDILAAGAFGNGLLLSAITAGTLVASSFMLRKSQIMEKKLGSYKWLATLTLIASLGFLPSIVLWAGLPAFLSSPLAAVAAWLSASTGAAISLGLLVAIPAVFLMKLAIAPLQQRMGTMLQNTINEDPVAEKHQEKIWSLMGFFEMLAAGAGGVAFSALYKNSGPGSAVADMIGANAPMKIVTAALVVTGIVYFLGLRVMKGQLTKIVRKVHESGGKEGATLTRLAANLKRMNLPGVSTRVEAEAVDPRRPTVVILSPGSVYKLSTAKEGARQSPGDVHLALDPSWLTQEIHPDGHTEILLNKGLTFEEGKPVVVEYKQPRKVGYFANFFTLGANDRDDGVPLEKGHSAPQSNSVELERITNDKLLTRILLAAKGVAVPATVAFLMAAHPLKGTSSASTTMQVRSMSEDKAALKSSIEEFLKHYKGEEVVVKPSGPQFHSGRGVRFFARGDVDAMVEHALMLSKDEQMTQDGAVLVDGRLAPPALYLRSGEGDRRAVLLNQMTPLKILSKDELASAGPKERKDWNIRVLAARAPWGKGKTTGMFVRAGAWGEPTTALPDTIGAKDLPPILSAFGLTADEALAALGARPKIDDVAKWAGQRKTLAPGESDALLAELRRPDAAAVVRIEDAVEALRVQHGLLMTDAEIKDFIADLEKMGADAVDVLAANEEKRERKEGEPLRAQTDFLGLDVMVVVENGKLVPKIIEVNDHDAGGQHELDLFYPERAGEHSREWMATALERARLHTLRGKRIAIIGAGYQGKRFIFERAKELGVKIVLVDKGPSKLRRFAAKFLKPFGVQVKKHWAEDLVSEFIAVDTTNHEEALAKARKKLQASARKNGQIDGIATFWEDDVPLTAELARAFKLPYHTVDAADSVRSKAKTRQVMRAAGLPTPRTYEIENPQDLEAGIRTVGFPAVLKPVFGAEAMGVVKVNNAEEARAAYAAISKQLTKEFDDIFAYGSQMLMEQYLDGREWDADVVMQDGKAVFVSVTDNWPTREPNFVATGSSLPSRSMSKAEQREVEELAEATAKALGLKDGVVHIEGKYTKEGPRIVEANGRMGGVYVRDWVKAVWGVDLVDQQLLAAAGIPVGAFKPARSLTHLEGEFIIHEHDGTLARQELAEGADKQPGFHNFRVMKKPGDRVKAPFQARTGMLEAKGATPEEAQQNLNSLRAQLILAVDEDGQ